MRALVTNDDGIDAPGVLELAKAVAAAGLEVVVAAPLTDQSGCGAGFGGLDPSEPVHLKPVDLPGLPGVPAYAVDGPPALAVILARIGAFGAALEPPDLVVSGVNPGVNSGPAILHSGTVGAALTAANFGLSALAVSVDLPPTSRRGPRFDVAARVAGAAIEWLRDAPGGTVLSLNVPDRPLSRIRGVRWAVPSPVSNVTAAIVDATDGRLRIEVTDNGQAHLPGTDTWTVDQGYVALTGVVGPRATEELPEAPVAVERALRGG